ncbi:MAG: uroporphyrinogen decarboxylase family protein [Oscillospiraceae bacterium]|jgi:uroporphyrinogen decarboxylase|nr:uroporphyrinogen decarboxylase family protein [Oscillospiraceae bacterium]
MATKLRDQMTPKERVLAWEEGRPIDRVPSKFSYSPALLKFEGVDTKRYGTDNAYKIATEVKIYEKYRTEELAAGFSVPGLYGATYANPEGGHAYILETVPLEGDDLKHPVITDPKTDPRLAPFWEYLDGILEALGDKVPLRVMMEGPITQAGRTIGVEKLLKKTLRDPEYVHAVLEHILQTQLTLISALEGYDIGFQIMDPVSSGDVLSPENYRAFAKPYLTRLFTEMTRIAGKKPYLHICGHTEKVLHDIVETGPAAFSVDNALDLAEVKREIGDKVTVIGNVHPTATMLLGTPEDVDADLKKCFQKAWDSPKGYIPGYGCGLPVPTPKENVDAVYDALWKYGRWPLNPENFS